MARYFVIYINVIHNNITTNRTLNATDCERGGRFGVLPRLFENEYILRLGLNPIDLSFYKN